MKTITVKQPWASLMFINNGYEPKNIENRTWPTKYRGKVLIHAGAKILRPQQCNFTDDQNDNIRGDMRYRLLHSDFPTSAIIGSVEIVDCVINHESIWAEKSDSRLDQAKKWIDKPIYNWVLANPVLFAKPIPAKGKLSFWDYPIEVCHICGQPAEYECKICGEFHCEKCQAKYDQFTQIDFDCCSQCADSRTL
jgi:hypothetical protein